MRTGLLAGVLCIASTAALAQGFPAKPLRVVSSSTAGSPGDAMLRMLSPKLQQALGQPVVIDTRVGAGGTLAAADVIRTGADGHSINFSSNMIVVSRYILKGAFIDVQKDLAPISQAASVTNFVVVHASVPASSLKELIDYARSNPGRLGFASNGTGSALHMVGEAFKLNTGTDLVHVPYSGASQGVRTNDILTGRVQIDWSAYNFIKPHLAGGRIKVLGVIDRKRHRELPDATAVTELFPDYRFASSWWGFFGAAGTAAPALARWETELQRAYKDPELTAKLEGIGLTPIGSSSRELAAVLKQDVELTERLAKLIGLKPE